MIHKSEVALNTLSIEKRIMGQVPKTRGTLTDTGGRTVPVNFSLPEWRRSVDGILGSRSEEGEMEFLNIADAFDLRDVDKGLTLRGGGIHAQVSMLSLRTFTVKAGSYRQAATPGTLRCMEMICSEN